jgi:Bacterial mobilisation protein (MobC)
MSWIWSGKGMNKTRPKQLSFRVSEEEYQQLQEKISESGKNQQEYILSCVLEKQIVNTDGIKELIPELKRIGNNLNKIAKRCNEGECCRVKRKCGSMERS